MSEIDESIQAAVYDRPKCRQVLDGDPARIEGALDALEAGRIVESSPEAVTDGECRAWAREVDFTGALVWRGTGSLLAKSSGFLAKRCAPLTVVA